MNHAHWILIILWVVYCGVHSFLADIKIKNHIEKIMGSGFIYYRPLYSIFAAAALAFVLWFQFSIPSPKLLSTAIFLYLPGIILSLTGLSIMLICINKYFYELSGLQALRNSQKNTLQQSGLHKYVRHPLYLGTLLFIWGLFLIFPLISNLICTTIITAYVLIGIQLEEKKLRLEYGEEYIKYAGKVPKIIPWIYTIKKGSV
ncbi:MAG: isoprenylcysteine carboxylmethyltransferase family protein [Ginsengibacter sp.]